MDELTEADIRFLRRVHSVTLTPWTGALVASDAKGKTMRLGKATFQKLKDGGFIIRSESSLTTNTYVVPDPILVLLSEPTSQSA
jgi:hypothetical protein